MFYLALQLVACGFRHYNRSAGGGSRRSYGGGGGGGGQNVELFSFTVIFSRQEGHSCFPLSPQAQNHWHCM